MARGLSELVSAALLIIIVVSIGGFIVVKLLSATQRNAELGRAIVERAYVASKQALGLILAYVDANNNLHILVASGSYPVKLIALYINGSPADGCSVFVGETSSRLELSIVPAYSIAHIVCNLSYNISVINVNLYYEGGNIAFLVSKTR